MNKSGKKSLKRNKEQGEEKKTKMKTTGFKGRKKQLEGEE